LANISCTLPKVSAHLLLSLLALSVAALAQRGAGGCADGSTAETGCRGQQQDEQLELEQGRQQAGKQGQCNGLPCWVLGVPVVGGVVAAVSGGSLILDHHRQRPYKQRAEYALKRLEEKWRYNKDSFAYECMEGCVKDAVSLLFFTLSHLSRHLVSCRVKVAIALLSSIENLGTSTTHKLV
jgi:hypothetical protein